MLESTKNAPGDEPRPDTRRREILADAEKTAELCEALGLNADEGDGTA